jgi:hypothetical protein
VQSICRIEEENQEKCIRQSVLIVGRNAKFHSNPTKIDLFTAESASQNGDPQEEDIRVNAHSAYEILALMPDRSFVPFFIFL